MQNIMHPHAVCTSPYYISLTLARIRIGGVIMAIKRCQNKKDFDTSDRCVRLRSIVRIPTEWVRQEDAAQRGSGELDWEKARRSRRDCVSK